MEKSIFVPPFFFTFTHKSVRFPADFGGKAHAIVHLRFGSPENQNKKALGTKAHSAFAN
ncbi:MAG: hypothetical protein FWG71_04260 [Synergistaceae bacterium]|nr:hypothetical protein [Synergistaceae bacterium]